MIWEKSDIAPELVRDLSARYGCDLLTASILARRGLTRGGDVRYFLEDDPVYLRNPFELPGMEDAVDRIIAAKEEGEKVLVFGDRDVDGITGTALLAGRLREMGLDVGWRVPLGDDAYGLSRQAVDDFAADSGTLIITVDCGISCAAEIAHAGELGIDVIVTDHHNPPETLPVALAVVNPKLREGSYPFRDLSGCAVAYKLVSALRFALRSELYGHSVCLLNVRPANDAFIVEAVKLRNLMVVKQLTETVVPGMAAIDDTRLPAFLAGNGIFVWDAPLQKKTLARIFGSGVEFNFVDMAPDIGKEIPLTAGKSLLRLRELSKMARYAENPVGELDVFLSLFTTFFRRREHHFSGDDLEDLQFACLGTIADMMPLQDENRIIVRSGLAALNKKPRPGLDDLIFKLGLAGKRIGCTDISWQLCPAINAAGRMGKPDQAARLLAEDNPQTRNALADEILAMNEDRKELGEKIWVLAEPRAEESLPRFAGKLVVAAGEDLYRGVTGIMANRLVNRFKITALVAAFAGDTATGSLRSPGNCGIRSMLEQCADLFLDWGGHDAAAGFTMKLENWETFMGRLEVLAKTLEYKAQDEEETALVDAEVPLSYLTPDLLRVVDLFEPYGEESPSLTFLARGLKITDLVFMGKTGQHVKLTLDAGNHKWPAVYWQAAERAKKDFDLQDTVDLLFRVSRNFFNGLETPQMIVTDLRRSAGNAP
ncbi:MAG: single-stranded-DNA-specific exonuclease RecJ [Spirochaetaceae bacterium]|jgi:single-stranded-DNA-specific exonuclease|nr:single-stranded-DNA-specific exonuclease RecJ [Spirochaetaceae bacterium]